MRLVEIAKPADQFTAVNILGTHVAAPEDAIKLIEVHCATILDAYLASGGVLYRGISEQRDSAAPIVAAKIRTDRRPVQMDAESHELLHSAFVKLGLKATRKNSIFCTARDELAHDWGQAYIVFPKDGWSATVYGSGKETYGFYKHQQYVKAAKKSLEFNQWKKNNPKLTHEPNMTVVGELAKILKHDDSPESIATAEGLAEIIRSEWADVLITGDSYVAVIVPELAKAKTDRQFVKAVLEGLGLKW